MLGWEGVCVSHWCMKIPSCLPPQNGDMDPMSLCVWSASRFLSASLTFLHICKLATNKYRHILIEAGFELGSWDGCAGGGGGARGKAKNVLLWRGDFSCRQDIPKANCVWHNLNCVSILCRQGRKWFIIPIDLTELACAYICRKKVSCVCVGVCL